MTSPKVSIIVPIFNVATFLPRCLDSLIGQTLSEIEIICVNDCSPDNAITILETYKQRDPRIVIISHEKNLKAAAARNSGLDVARGEYVGFCDGDDFVELDFYKNLYSVAKSHKAAICKGITKEFINGETFTHNTNKQINKNKFCFMWHPFTGLYERSFLQKNKVRFVVDCICFQIQAVYFSNKVVAIENTFYNYIRRENSCDNKCFSLEKWEQLNIRGADFVLDFINTVEIDKENYLLLVTSLVYPLYFYGFSRLSVEDTPLGVKKLSDVLTLFWLRVHYKEELKNRYLKQYSQKLAELNYKKYPKGSPLYCINKIFLKIRQFFYHDYIGKGGARKIKIFRISVYRSNKQKTL